MAHNTEIYASFNLIKYNRMNFALNNLNLYNGDYKEFRSIVKRIFNDNFFESKIILNN